MLFKLFVFLNLKQHVHFNEEVMDFFFYNSIMMAVKAGKPLLLFKPIARRTLLVSLVQHFKKHMNS
jgi:hypothetical protein